MERYGFFHDTARCVDCKACQVACKEKNKLSAGEFFRRAETIVQKDENAVSYVRFSAACNHCADPACVKVCPTGAMYVAADGTVQHKNALCIGCGRCLHHCPYGAVSFNKYSGYAQKCDACADRRAEGRSPVCVEACPMEALHFGPISALRRQYGEDLGASVSYLPVETITKPSLLVRGGKKTFTEAPLQEAVSPAAAANTVSSLKVLILGSGAAAIAAACELRRRSSSVRITLVSREKALPYSRPMLSKALTASFAEDRYDIVEENWLDRENIAFIGSAEITALSPAAHSVTLADGRVLPYDKCIYALGSDCFRPDIKGSDLQGVYTLRSVSDLAALRREMLTAKRAVIIGGGITGTEFSWELKRSGLEVTVVEPLPQLMDRFLDSRSAKLLTAALNSCGIRTCFGTPIRTIDGSDRVRSLSLADGTQIPADLILLSAGYRANVSLAAEAGLAADALIHVNPGMETSDPDIFACGDCTDLSGATWAQSVRQGRVAAANALGGTEEFSTEREATMVHAANTSLLVIGDMGKNSSIAYTHYCAKEAINDDLFRVNPLSEERKSASYSFCFAEDKLVGAAIVGDLSAMELVEQAVREGWCLDALRKELITRGVDVHEG